MRCVIFLYNATANTEIYTYVHTLSLHGALPILAVLSTMPKATPARWLYDKRGSELFEEITALPEYYPTRVETELLRTHGEEIGRIVGSGRAVVEFGDRKSTRLNSSH